MGHFQRILWFQASIALIALPSLAAEPVEFAQGTKAISLYAGYVDQPSHHREQLGFVSLGGNYYYRDNWAVGVEFTGLEATQQGGDARAGGGDILLRSHWVQIQRVSLFTDVALGFLQASHRVPAGGTFFNFTTQTGIGATLELTDNVDLITGLRYFHLSNARLDGPRRNPSINGIEGYLGMMYEF